MEYYKKQTRFITTGSFGNTDNNFFAGRPAASFEVATRLALTTAAPGASGAARHVVCSIQAPTVIMSSLETRCRTSPMQSSTG